MWRTESLSEVIEDLTFEEFHTPSQRIISCPKEVGPAENEYVVCPFLVHYSKSNEPCGRVGLIHWTKVKGAVIIEHGDGTEHKISYFAAMELKPASIDEENHRRIVELTNAVRGD
jgi:hypothetical protein